MKSTKSRHVAQPRKTGMKNHQLEGDGVVTGFYNLLHKRDNKTMKACQDVLIPDTIVFDHNFPRGWFTSDMKSKEITKKQGKDLDATSIAECFSKPPSPSVNVVATYMCSYEEEDPQTRETVTITSVEFFNEETLKEFVSRKTKREGILQRFIAPKDHRNSVIQAIWSPRMLIVQRRTNRGSIKDKIQCERDPYPVTVTYEGPSHFSEESTCADHTHDKVLEMCSNISKHFSATEHKNVTRMVLYFKVDEKDQLWLLWCGSLRVSDKDQPSELPLNLAPKFDSPSLEAASPRKEDAELYAADMKHLEMTNDTLFYTTYVKGQEKKEGLSTTQGTHSQASSVVAGTKSSNQGKANPNEPQAEDEWHKHPSIQDKYRVLCIDRETVLSAFEDIFYEAYGHFLRYDPGPFNFEVDRKVAHTLGVDILQEIMTAVKIPNTSSSDEGAQTVDDDELCFTIPAQKTGPIKQLGDHVARLVNQHFDRREKDLKDEAEPTTHDDEDKPADAPPPARKEQPAPAAAAPAKEEPKEEKPAPAPAQQTTAAAPQEKPAPAKEEAPPRSPTPEADEPPKEEAKPAEAPRKETDTPPPAQQTSQASAEPAAAVAPETKTEEPAPTTTAAPAANDPPAPAAEPSKTQEAEPKKEEPKKDEPKKEEPKKDEEEPDWLE